MLVPQSPQHCKTSVECYCQISVPAMVLHEISDVCHVAHMLQEAAMRAGHVGAHFVDEVMTRWRCLAFTLRATALLSRLLAGRSVLNAENDVKELDERALGVAATTQLSVFLSICAVIKQDAVWEAGLCHVFATSEKRADAVVEDVRIAILIHLLQDRTEFV